MSESMSESEGREDLVVVGVDGSSKSLEALEWAARYAEAFNLRVRAVYAWHFPVGYGYVMTMPDIDLAAESKEILQSALEGARERHPHVRFESEVIDSPAAAALLDVSQKAALLVVGSRGHGGFAGMLIGSVSTHCVHHATCPVVVIR